MLYITLLLLGSIAAIILLSSRYRLNTFFVLLLVALATGLIAGLEGEQVLKALRTGFGGTLEKIGLLILFGATLGALLDRSHATVSLARFILGKTGQANAPAAMVLVGYVVGMPIFCDSGFVVLSGLALMLSLQVPGFHLRLVSGLAIALFAVHCLAPPHPGISAAAGALRVDLGKAMLTGALVAIPTIWIGWLWLRRQSRSEAWNALAADVPADALLTRPQRLPSPFFSFLPIAVPIGLIALKSMSGFFSTEAFPRIFSVINFFGDPAMALLCGIFLSLFLFEKWDKPLINSLLDNAIEKSGPILAITAAGGAFGEVIRTLEPGRVYGEWLSNSGLGLWAPFLLAAILKTAQGSSTVSVITTAGIVAPLLPALGLSGEFDSLLALMAMGAGSMIVSHANDSYFWVVSRFGQLPVDAMLKVFSIATFIMGATAFAIVWLMKILL